MTPPTRFVESNALLAVQQGDDDDARKGLIGLYASELRSLRSAALRLVELIDEENTKREGLTYAEEKARVES